MYNDRDIKFDKRKKERKRIIIIKNNNNNNNKKRSKNKKSPNVVWETNKVYFSIGRLS
jgi:hypothetical protein